MHLTTNYCRRRPFSESRRQKPWPQPIGCVQAEGRSKYMVPASRSEDHPASISAGLKNEEHQPTIAQSRRQVLHSAFKLACLTGLLSVQPVPAEWAAAAGQEAESLPPLPPGPRPLSAEAQKSVNAALSKIITKQKAPAALRLIFHDSATYRVATGDGGANGSVRFELDRPESFGLKRSWRLVEQLRDELQTSAAAREVSLTDLIVLAAAHAVKITGGPTIPVLVGRRDVAAADPTDRMPGEKLSAADQKAVFAAAGINVREMVALLGSHTIGGKGFGDAVKFDNAYYKTLLARPWLNKEDEMASMIGLPSDHVLPEDEECLPIIKEYAQDEQLFFADFSNAFTKLAGLNTVWV